MARMRMRQGSRDLRARVSPHRRPEVDGYLIDDLHRHDLVALLDRVDDGHVLGAAEDGMHAIEMRRRDVGDEELAAAGVLARRSPGERARGVLLRVDRAL